MRLSFQQMENLAEDDLEWFFNYSESDCGVRSNWTAMVSASCFGGSNYNFYDNTNSFILGSISRSREITEIYKNLEPKLQNILFATFGQVHISAYVQKIFKQYSGTAYTILSKDQLESLCQRVSMSQCQAGDKLLLSRTRTQALMLYRQAITTYVNTRLQNKQGQSHV